MPAAQEAEVLRAVTALMLVLSAALFEVGALRQFEATRADRPATAAAQAAVPSGDDEPLAGGRLNSVAAILTATVVSVLLGAALLATTSRRLLPVVAAFALGFAVLDRRELSRLAVSDPSELLNLARIVTATLLLVAVLAVRALVRPDLSSNIAAELSPAND